MDYQPKQNVRYLSSEVGEGFQRLPVAKRSLEIQKETDWRPA